MLSFNKILELPLDGTGFVGTHAGSILTTMIDIIARLRRCACQAFGRGL